MYPKLQFRASQLADAEKYPKTLFIVIPTWKERPKVTEQMLQSVLAESIGLPSEVVVLVNAGSDEEDDLFRKIHREFPGDTSNVRMEFIRQVGGKRQGMADCLYRLGEIGIDDSDIVTLMDGDAVLGAGVYEKCLPLFGHCPKVDAITTDNISVTEGHWLYRKWYTLRFSMRHRYMKSLSLSRQLQVLTGRFSLFRARDCIKQEFISSLETVSYTHLRSPRDQRGSRMPSSA